MKKKLPVMAEFEYSCPLEPFTIAFVYPRIGDSFVVKGGYSDVKKFIANNVKEGKIPACLVNFTQWRDKKVMEDTSVYGLDPDVFIQIVKQKDHGTRRFHYTAMLKNSIAWGPDTLVDKWIRRRPRKWLKDFDAFLK